MRENYRLSAYCREMNKAVTDANVQLAMGRAVTAYKNSITNVFTQQPQTKELAREVRSIKEKSILQMEELYLKAKQNIEANQGHVYLARSREDVQKKISAIVGRDKVVVKTKSILGEEVGIREHLLQTGNEVWESDLGELIFQLQAPKTKQLAPAMDITREQVAGLFTEFFGQKIPPDISEQTEVVRNFLRDKFFQADVGISSANAVSADTGALIIVECEGNVRLATGVPPVHIAVVGLEKLVDKFSDALKIAEVTWRYAGFVMPSYVNIISSPSKTADIEKVLVHGVHGPKELHVIFVDNGRTAMAEQEEFREALYCLRCDACTLECPVFRVTGSRFGRRYLGGIGAVWTAFVDGGLEAALPIFYTCLRCGRCVERCPLAINVPQMIIRLRNKAVAAAKMPEETRGKN
ncbi:MAG: LUD domain-containing protein [Peptococcaceae bacterium]